MPGPVAKKACHNLVLRGHTQEAGLDVRGGGWPAVAIEYVPCPVQEQGKEATEEKSARDLEAIRLFVI